ncbi:hypothetical protein AHF37_00503 [Paragonimus kellicotti]|nr:hypothetical protein AHF37_00503 [Paragonimus kellicotti]
MLQEINSYSFSPVRNRCLRSRLECYQRLTPFPCIEPTYDGPFYNLDHVTHPSGLSHVAMMMKLMGNTPNMNATGFHSENSSVPVGQEAELARLIAERDELLNTGVYDNDDPIILNLDGQIQMLSARK